MLDLFNNRRGLPFCSGGPRATLAKQTYSVQVQDLPSWVLVWQVGGLLHADDSEPLVLRRRPVALPLPTLLSSRPKSGEASDLQSLEESFTIIAHVDRCPLLRWPRM